MIIEARRDVVSLRGTLNENQWDAIATAVDLVLPDHPQGILLDCSALTSMSEMGSATFMDGLSYMEVRGARIILCSVPPAIQKILKAVPGLHSQVPTAESVEQGRQSLMAGQTTPLTTRTNARVVVVPVSPPFSIEAVHQLLQRLHAGSGIEFHFIYVLMVPRSLPVGAPLPDEEKKAEEVLDLAQAFFSTATIERHVIRSRSISDAIVEAATKLGAEEILAGIGIDKADDEATRGVLQSLRAQSPCSLTLTQESNKIS